MKMKFSVTIPAFKTVFLERAIKSVLSQTYSDFELIIVDDCSPENINSVVSKFNDNRIRYYRNEKNCGAVRVVDNWNICLNYARGEYVICMGDDDLLAPNALAEYNRLSILYPNINLLHSRVIIINENDLPVSITPERPEQESHLSFIYNRLQGRIQFIGDFCFKTEKLRKFGGFYFLPLAWASDDISSFICSDNGVANTNIPTFFYRINQYTISNNGKTEIKLDAINKEQDWYEDYFRNYKANTLIEKLELKEIKKNITKSFIKKRARTIGTEMSNNFLSLFKWIYYQKKYRLNSKIFLLSIIEYLKK